MLKTIGNITDEAISEIYKRGKQKNQEKEDSKSTAL